MQFIIELLSDIRFFASAKATDTFLLKDVTSISLSILPLLDDFQPCVAIQALASSSAAPVVFRCTTSPVDVAHIPTNKVIRFFRGIITCTSAIVKTHP